MQDQKTSKRDRPKDKHHDPNYVPKHPKPFVSKQTRNVTGKKQTPGHPSMAKIVHGPDQFYFRGYVFPTKKQLRDRIKQLLLAISGAPCRPDAPGGMKGDNHKKRRSQKRQGLDEKVYEEPIIVNATEYTSLSATMCDLISRHPNYENWGNKHIESFKVVRAESRKSQPILLATFKGNPDKWRDMDWMKLVYKSEPTHADKLYSCLWHAIRHALAKPITPPELVLKKKSVACTKCGLDRLWIDEVHPSHNGAPFHQLAHDFLVIQQVVPAVFEWHNQEASFCFRPCDADFKSAWIMYHTTHASLSLLCETCRIEHWVAEQLK